MLLQQGECHQASLLDEAPVAGVQRKEGYNVDLFDDCPSRSPPTQPLSPPPPYDSMESMDPLDDRHSRPLFTQLLSPPPLTDTDVENNSQRRSPPPTFPYPREPAQSFWRTRKRVVIIFIIVIFVVGGAIGGAIGETVSNKQVNVPSGNSTSSSSSSTSSSPNLPITLPLTTPSPTIPFTIPAATSTASAGAVAVLSLDHIS